MSKYINKDEFIKAVILCNDELFSKNTVYALVELVDCIDFDENTESNDYSDIPMDEFHN